MVQNKSTSPTRPEPTAEPRKRGRPRAYDPDAALAEAMGRFWDAGYAATSLDHLSEATGMNRPSLYGAFGDKKALYLKTLEAYRALGRTTMTVALAGEDSLAAALGRVYGKAIEIYLSGPIGARGCYLLGTAATESVLDADIRAAFADGLHELDQLITDRIRRAQRLGEIDKKADAGVLAKLAIGLLNTLSLRARAGESRTALEAVAKASVKLICAK